MHLVKPLWLKHTGDKRDLEVYSCHVSPDGSRLVTAAGDGYVRIWSTKAISEGVGPDSPVHKQLAALSYHSGTIHTVRFSPNNKFLASGADDKIVCIYVLDPNPPAHTSFGSNETAPVENWRIFRRLIGHENDVQDLGWSADSSILVSVGLDSRVVVWSGHTFEKLKTISQHGSHVKGITFDPANKYFATASDDRTIKIYRYTPPQANSTASDQSTNFTVEHTISDPFITSPLTTYFRRCSWSPDGMHIAAANAVNGPLPTAAIISRGSWESEINLIGHEGPIEACAFSPRLFCSKPTEGLDAETIMNHYVTVIACAGQDKALTIWTTSNSKPIGVFEGLSLKAISDLAWTPDGESLFITSLDGSIVLAKFGRGELGYPAPAEVNETNLTKYGGGRKVGMVQGPDAFVLEEKSKDDELKNVKGRMGELMGGAEVSNLNGKPGANGDQMSKSKDKDTTMTNGDNTTSTAAKAEDVNAARVNQLKNRVTYTKDGKKRVAPLLVSSAAGAQESSLPSAQLVSSTQQTFRNDQPQVTLDLSKPYDGLPKGGIASLLIGNKRKFAETGAEDDNAISQHAQAAEKQGARAIMANTAEGLVPASSVNVAEIRDTMPSLLNPGVIMSPVRLAVPLIRSQVTRTLRLKGKDDSADDAHLMEVKNAMGRARTGRPQDREPARVTVSKRGQILWQDYLPRPVVLVTGNNRWWAAACEDGSVYTWTAAGRRMFNAFALEAQPTILDCRGPWLLCVSAVGLAHIYNLETSSAPHPPISLAPIMEMAALSGGPHLTSGPGIIFARLTSEGRIVVAMSNGDAFTYSPRMYTWQRLSEGWWAAGSQYWNTNDSATLTQLSSGKEGDAEEDDLVKTENIAAGVIPLLERTTTTQVMLHGRAYHLSRLIKALLSAEGYEGFESAVSVAHLENRLAAALTLGAKDEFKLYLGMYAKRIGAEGLKLKIEELLRSLLAGVFDDEQASSLLDGSMTYLHSSTDELCGWKKDALLREVVLILGKYRDLQRIIVPYARLLGVTASAGAEDSEMQ